MEQRENSVREWVADKTLSVKHVQGTCNPSDIFTKEMKDGSHFRRLRDSFMCRHSSFLRDSLLSLYHQHQAKTLQPLTFGSTAPSLAAQSAFKTQHVFSSSNISSSKTNSSVPVSGARVSFAPGTPRPSRNSVDRPATISLSPLLTSCLGHCDSMMSVMMSSPLFRTNLNLSHLSSGARHLMRHLSSAPMGGVSP